VHAAKGLEFDAVFLAGCEQGLLPLRLPGSGPGTEEEVAEERRLLFVACTRARAKLLLSCAARRTRYGSDQPAGRSPFLSAIDPEIFGAATSPRSRPPAARQLRLL
jgi:superfamily I DNA/RNA helicase